MTVDNPQNDTKKLISVSELTGKKECPLYLFVRWKKGVRSYGPETSTYNGDKYVHDGNYTKMLQNLLTIFLKDYSKMAVALIYDNRVSKFSPERNLLKLHNGTIESRLQEYPEWVADFPLPEWLK